MKKNLLNESENAHSSENQIELGKFGMGLAGLPKENLFIGNGTPSIHLLIGMRDLGYTNVQAMCDILDNSIDAIAKDGKGIIRIKTDFDSKEKNSIIIIDNGCGMNLETLSKALILGKEEERNYDELGKFGLGGKASALSMGKSLKIITKSQDDNYYTGVYDFDKAFKLNAWNFPEIIESPDEDVTYFKENLQESTGTIVLISKLDKLENDNSTQLNNRFKKHIAEIFRNFISTSKDDDKINFLFNDKKLTPIDPMCRDLQERPDFYAFNPADEDYEVEINGKKYTFKVECFHIPDIDDDSPESQNNMRSISFKNSGFYIMRNNRQIQRASWSVIKKTGFNDDVRLRHSTGNAFRGEIYFNSDADEIFKTDTKKMTVNFPQQVIDKIDLEVGSYMRGVSILHGKEYKNRDILEVQKDLEKIARKMNNKISTPTVLRNKEEKDIASEAPEIESKNTDIKKKEHSRNRNKKVDFKTFAGGVYAPFFDVKKMGIKKYVLEFNTDHIFYEKFMSLDREAKEIVFHLLHSLGLTLYSELYDVYDCGDTKIKLICEFLEKFSNFFKKDSES